MNTQTKVTLSTKSLHEVLEKANRLIQLLREVEQILSSLSPNYDRLKP